jgi:hypothetical protein
MPRRLLFCAILLLGLLAVPALQPAAEAGKGRTLRAQALVTKLKTQRLKNVTFKEVDLPGLLKWLRLATGHNYVLDRKGLMKAGIDPKDVTFTAVLKNVTVASVIQLALEPLDLAAVVKGNVVWITTHAKSLGKPITRMYAISHITWRKVDFIAPDINLHPSGFIAPEEYEPERVVEDDPLGSGDQVAELLMELVGRGEWDNEGWSMSATDRYVVVRAPRAIHRQIPRALSMIASLK